LILVATGDSLDQYEWPGIGGEEVALAAAGASLFYGIAPVQYKR
jgi:hypothetical protein